MIHLDHHLYNHLKDRWIRQSSKPHPFLTLTVTAHPEDYTALGYNPINPQPKTITISAMADTGCQSCLAGIKVIRGLSLCTDDQIPITMHVHAASNNGIRILGAIILRFAGRSPSGQTLETRQIVYVTSDADKLFLSREACTALGMISENFSTVGETQHLSKAMVLDVDLDGLQ